MGVLDNNAFGTPIAGYPLYSQIRDILGSTGTIIPIGDTAQENAARTIVTTVGGLVVPFTYSEPVTSFDTPPTIKGPGRIPIITFNGTDEEADTPDAAYWSAGDGLNDSPFSMGVWVNITDTATFRYLLNKHAGGNQEWFWRIRNDEKLHFRLRDNSAGVGTDRTSNAALSTSTWLLLTVTYDGAGGGSAADTITLYVNRSVEPSNASNNGAYVAMEDLGAVVNLGSQGGSDPFAGLMAGGPLGPFFTQIKLTAADVALLHNIGASAMGE